MLKDDVMILKSFVDNSQDYYKLLQYRINEMLITIQNADIKPISPIDSHSFTRQKIHNTFPNSNIYPNTTNILTSESTLCSYRTISPFEDDIWYITLYTKTDINCLEIGKPQNIWHIDFDNEEQYHKIMDLINQFPYDWNMRFASHKNFFIDFLDDMIDIEEFMTFMENTNKGVPDYSNTISNRINKNEIKWAKYLNPPDRIF